MDTLLVRKFEPKRLVAVRNGCEANPPDAELKLATEQSAPASERILIRANSNYCPTNDALGKDNSETDCVCVQICFASTFGARHGRGLSSSAKCRQMSVHTRSVQVSVVNSKLKMCRFQISRM